MVFFCFLFFFITSYRKILKTQFDPLIQTLYHLGHLMFQMKLNICSAFYYFTILDKLLNSYQGFSFHFQLNIDICRLTRAVQFLYQTFFLSKLKYKDNKNAYFDKILTLILIIAQQSTRLCLVSYFHLNFYGIFLIFYFFG